MALIIVLKSNANQLLNNSLTDLKMLFGPSQHIMTPKSFIKSIESLTPIYEI